MKQILLSLELRFSSAIIVLLLLMGSVTSAQTPTITSVTPTVVTKNTVVTINGTNFGTGSYTVSFSDGNTNFSIVTGSRTTTQVKITITGTVSGSVRINRVQAPVASSAYSAAVFTYAVPIQKTAADGIRVQQIYTDWNGYWTSSATTSTVANQPNNHHNLLAFKYGGVVYSTGVNDATLTANGVSFNAQSFRAYSTQGVDGTIGGATYLATGSLIDENSSTAIPSHPEIAGIGIYDVLIDGLNGLDLGTGVTNFNTNAKISFFSDNAQTGTSNAYITDDVPDVLITQVADPGSTDYYHFTDVNGNIIGNPVRVDMQTSMAAVGTYRLDLFNFGTTNIATATPSSVNSSNTTRDIRIVGLRFSDFGITAANISQIKTFDMLAGGTADVAFLAYNTASFQIASPVVTSAPNSVRLCKVPYPSNVSFSVGAGIAGGGPGTLTYQWKKNNIDILATDTRYSGANTSTLIINGTSGNPITASEYATYKVEISNAYGAIVASSAILRPGGSPTVWNGTSWSATPTSTSSLIFNANYDSAVNLASGTKIEGCDCKVQNGVNVIIDSGDAMIIQNQLEVAPVIPAHMEPQYDGSGNYIGDAMVPTQPAGTYTLRDDASLIQVSETAANIGVITKKRQVTNLHQWDYVYWSSPVDGFDISSLVPYSTLAYRWNPTLVNPNMTYGNWASASGVMAAATGYISRVNSAANLDVTFVGAPHNGVYNYTLTGSTNAAANTNYWNLVGNPYPSSIKALDFINSNPSIEGNIRIWTHQAPISNNPAISPFYNNFTYNYGDQYLTYNGTTSVPPGFNGNIASGQGFFVQGKSTSGTVTFQNTFRYKETLPVYNNSQFYRTSAQAQDATESLPENPGDDSEASKSIIWLSLVNAANSSVSTAIGYVEGATMEKDRVYDASTEAGTFSIYSLINEDKVIINGRALPFEDSDTVPVGFAVPSTGIYNIAVNQVQGLFEDQTQAIYLKDNYLDIIHDLRAAPYTFTALSGNFENRFTLQYTTNALSVGDQESNNTFAFISHQTLQVQASSEIKNIEIFDLSGKHVTTYTVSDHGNQFSSAFGYATGFYLAKINLANGISVTQKVVTD
ncbi:T9SS type A sorting domain-containing protein [Flavobacterium silvaticum]|uniref:T9SS type A sorting domain-containing protein n=1 Tax=Flavobacterium silvaticum TaxID=1852020 RepID=A0A972FNP6_9FLAO|nr:T9SS type A sorting domain-containing protein [Flavobacterium silvaticum]NMH28600.1 T9SS type A sorting domain-containing protein [Flavobacterium silvaticum]